MDPLEVQDDTNNNAAAERFAYKTGNLAGSHSSRAQSELAVAPGSGGGAGPASDPLLNKNASALTQRPSTFIQKASQSGDDILEEHGVDQKPLLLMDD